MSERYGKLYQKMVDMLEKLDPEELDRRSDRRAAIDELSPGKLASMWVDIDASVADAGGVRSRAQETIDQEIDRHIGRIEAWLISIEE
jgi:uncharacterized protein